MKRIIGIIALSACILLLSAASTVSWEGRAVLADNSLFPADGKYARSRVFSKGEMVEIYNPSNETKTTVVIIGPSDVSGVLIMLSPQAASELSISEGYDAIVRVNKKQLYTEPSILSDSIAFQDNFSKDPDLNPRVAVESKMPSSFFSDTQSNQAKKIEKPEEPVSSPKEIAPEPVVLAQVEVPQEEPITDKTPVAVNEVDETDKEIVLAKVEPDLINPVITKQTQLHTHNEIDGIDGIDNPRRMATARSFSSVRNSNEENPLLYTYTGVNQEDNQSIKDEPEPFVPVQNQESPELYTYTGVNKGTESITDKPEPSLYEQQETPVLYTYLGADKSDTQTITDKPEPSLYQQDVPVLYTYLGAGNSDTQTITDKPEPSLYQQENSSIIAQVKQEDDFNIASLIDAPKYSQTNKPQIIQSSVSVDIGDGEFILIPTDLLPPDLIINQDTRDNIENKTNAITQVPVVHSTNKIDSDSLKSTSQLSFEDKQYIAKEFSSLYITEFEHGKYYIQLGLLHDMQRITSIVKNYQEIYPIKLKTTSNDTTCQVLVGPLTNDEYGAVLERFKRFGFTEAFVRKTL